MSPHPFRLLDGRKALLGFLTYCRLTFLQSVHPIWGKPKNNLPTVWTGLTDPLPPKPSTQTGFHLLFQACSLFRRQCDVVPRAICWPPRMEEDGIARPARSGGRDRLGPAHPNRGGTTGRNTQPYPFFVSARSSWNVFDPLPRREQV